MRNNIMVLFTLAFAESIIGHIEYDALLCAKGFTPGSSDRPLESPHLHNKISSMLSTAVCQKHGLGLHGIAELVQHLRSQTFVAVLAQLVLTAVRETNLSLPHSGQVKCNLYCQV